jgi:murein L,D-transpeptidase YcbB/YkuD
MKGLFYMIAPAFAIAFLTALTQPAHSMDLQTWKAALETELENPAIGPASPEHDQAIRYTLAQMAAFDEPRYILVNVPAFTLYAVENGQEAMRSKVIVGKAGTRSGGATPMLDTNVVGFTYNPSWTPTPSITKKKLAMWAKDPEYLNKQHVGVYDRSGQLVDSTLITPATFREEGMRLWQKPGNNNALGQFKFVLDNNQNIYMHDTNERKLFARERRAFSSGCVRVESWLKLAAWVSGMSEEDIEKHLARGNHGHSVTKVPVHIVYWPAVLLDDGSIKIYPDVYKRIRL